MTQDVQAVITEYGPALARIAASYERDRALREELLQEILLAIVSSLPRLRDESKLKPFLFRIAHNRGVSHILERKSEPSYDLESEHLAEDALTHEQAMIVNERSEALLKAIHRLTLPYRQVITLLLEDLNYPQIAEVLGISTINVGVRVNRAKQQLRGLLTHVR